MQNNHILLSVCLLLAIAVPTRAQDFDIQVRQQTVTTEYYYGHTGSIREDTVANWQIDSLDSVKLHEANASLLQKASEFALAPTPETTATPDSLTINISGQGTTFYASGMAPPDAREDGRLSSWAKAGAGLAILLVAPELALAGAIATDVIGVVNPLQDLVDWGTQDAERRAWEAAQGYKAACFTVGRNGRVIPVTYTGGFDFVRKTLKMPGAPNTLQAYVAGSVLSKFTGKLNLDPYEDFAAGMFVSSMVETMAKNEAALRMSSAASSGSTGSFSGGSSITGSQISLGMSVLGNMDLSLSPTLPSVASPQVRPNLMPVTQLVPVSAASLPKAVPVIRAIKTIQSAGVTNVEIQRSGQDVVTFVPQTRPSTTTTTSSHTSYRESNLNLPKSISLTGDFGGFSFSW